MEVARSLKTSFCKEKLCLARSSYDSGTEPKTNPQHSKVNPKTNPQHSKVTPTSKRGTLELNSVLLIGWSWCLWGAFLQGAPLPVNEIAGLCWEASNTSRHLADWLSPLSPILVFEFSLSCLLKGGLVEGLGGPLCAVRLSPETCSVFVWSRAPTPPLARAIRKWDCSGL